MKQFARKLIDLRTRLWLYLFRVFTKIRANRVILWSTRGSQYSCNPKYIAEYLSEKEPGCYDITFAFKPQCMDMSVPDTIRKVRIYNWSHRLPGIVFLYYLSTSKYIITNFRCSGRDGMLSKRSGQFYIMTYHGGWGTKPIEADHFFSERSKALQKKENDITDLFLSSCPDRTMEIRRAQGYRGNILELGSPRDDIFFDKKKMFDTKEIVYSFYNIPRDCGLILYAPTFRDQNHNNLDVYKINWSKVISAFTERFGCNFYVLLRLHSHIMHLSNDVHTLMNDPRTINATRYSDMQELLAASDFLITDYSSSPFDYAYTGRACFLYCPDYEQYITMDRTELKLDIRKLPFPYSGSEQELCDCVLSFDYESYRETLSDYLKNELHTFETGHACEALAAWMKENK